MGDWTSQNWTKRDGRNNQQEQQQQQEKKVTYKTAAELAVKKSYKLLTYWQASVVGIICLPSPHLNRVKVLAKFGEDQSPSPHRHIQHASA